MTENFFVNDRLKYTFDGQYAHGCFFNSQAQDFEKPLVQLHATEKTLEQFNHARKVLNERALTLVDELDEPRYMTSTAQLTKLLHNTIINDLQVVQEAAEFICDMGNQDPQHTLRLVEYHSEKTGTYLVLVAGAPMLEAVLNDLNFTSEVFEPGENGQYYANNAAFLEAMAALAQSYFDLDVAGQLVAQTEVFAVGGPFINHVNALGSEDDDLNRICFIARVK